MSLSEELDSTTRTTAGTVHRHDTTETFESTDPASGAVVGVFPVHDADAVRATVERARPAAAAWRELGFDGRRTRLAASRGDLARRQGAPPRPPAGTSGPTSCTARTANRTPTRSSRSPSPSTTSPGPARTPARCSASAR